MDYVIKDQRSYLEGADDQLDALLYALNTNNVKELTIEELEDTVRSIQEQIRELKSQI